MKEEEVVVVLGAEATTAEGDGWVVCLAVQGASKHEVLLTAYALKNWGQERNELVSSHNQFYVIFYLMWLSSFNVSFDERGRVLQYPILSFHFVAVGGRRDVIFLVQYFTLLPP
jgi:hypothetical protein